MGILDRPARRVPYTSGCFLPRGDLLALGRKHGHARISGALFAAAHLPALPLLGPVLETAGKLTPRFGAFQILAVRTGPQAGPPDFPRRDTGLKGGQWRHMPR